MTDLNELAREIIKNNQYLVLSTVGKNSRPWTSILAYSFDDKYNFYYASLPSSVHSADISKRKKVAFSIFDSRQGFGTGVGLQIEAVAEEVEIGKTSEILKIYLGREFPYGDISNGFSEGLKKMIEDRIYRFYKLSPTHVWINDPNADTDKRVEINL